MFTTVQEFVTLFTQLITMISDYCIYAFNTLPTTEIVLIVLVILLVLSITGVIRLKRLILLSFVVLLVYAVWTSPNMMTYVDGWIHQFNGFLMND